MAEISPVTPSRGGNGGGASSNKLINNRILNRLNETVNGSQIQLQSLLTSAANAVSSIISSSTAAAAAASNSSSASLSTGTNSHATSSASSSASSSSLASPHLMINSASSSSSSSSSGPSSNQHTPNNQLDRTTTTTGASTTPTSNEISLPSNWSYNHSITSSVKLDKKMFDKVNKLADKLLKLCQSDQMRLINSPPYIIDILPDMCQIFSTVYFVYEHKLGQLNEIDYFCVLMRNCLDKFQELVDLFKAAGKRMYEETSTERQKLVKYTLIYSHMLAEMKCMFPKDVYEGESFRIAKKDAAEFWKSNFGDRVIVSWREFELKLNQVHHISNQMELNSLRETIQLTKTKYHINKPGSYLFRLSCTKLGQWAIGYVTQDHKILQTIPQSLIQALIDGQKQGLYVYPDGRDIKIDISSAIAIMSASRIQCSREQYEMYCDMGTSFQLCKICSENNKDRKLEPCGHLICSTCLESWQELQTQPSCPFCRCEIKTFEPVVICPFEGSNRIRHKSESLLIDDTSSLKTPPIDNNQRRKSTTTTNKSATAAREDESAAAAAAAAAKSSSEKARSESMRCDSKATSNNKSLSSPRDNNKNSTSGVGDNLQTVSLNSLNQSLINNGDLSSSRLINNDDEDDYLRPSRPNSLQNSSLHLIKLSDEATTTTTRNSILTETSSNSSIEAQTPNTTNLNSKYNLDLLLTTSPSSTRESLLPPPPPIPSARLSTPSTATTASKSTTKMPHLPPCPPLPPPPPPPPATATTKPPPSSSSVLSPPSLPPPPLPSTVHYHPTSDIIVCTDTSASSKTSTIRLRIDNEFAFEQALAQLATSDRVRAACALFLAGNDVKAATSILNSTTN